MAPPSSMKKKKKESAILKTRVGTTYIVLLLSLKLCLQQSNESCQELITSLTELSVREKVKPR